MKHIMPKYSYFFLFAAILPLLIFACSQSSTVEDKSKGLAKVNGEVITETQLDVSLDMLFGTQTAQISTDAKRKALEGLVSSRAIAQKSEQELSTDELLELEYKTLIYREKLLVAEYLKRHARPEVVSNELVEKYYQQHPEEFGGGVEKEFELIMAAAKPTADKREVIIKRLSQAASQNDWQQQVSVLKRTGFDVQYRHGKVSAELLDEKLLQLADSTKVGETSAVAFIEGKPLILRMISEKKRQAEPLHNVSAEIHKKLMPIRLKEQIKQVSEAIVVESQIEYLED